MYTLKSILAVIISVLVFGAFLMGVYSLWNANKEYGNRLELRESCTEGEIVDKSIEDAHENLFRYVPPQYLITVKCSYEYNGEIIEDEKNFSVERDVYLAYNVGDWFDSHTLDKVAQNEDDTEEAF